VPRLPQAALKYPLNRVTNMSLPRFAVVDLETSGLNTTRHRVLQVGVVTVDSAGVVLDEWETFVRLKWPLSRVGPTHIHGITRSMLRGAPTVAAMLETLHSKLEGSLFVAHNARFDGEFLIQAAQRAGQSSAQMAVLERRLCTLRMSRRLDPGREFSHRLGDLCERYDVALDRPHNALADAHSTAAMLPHLLIAHDVQSESDLTPFLDRNNSR
jgi:DNA polymerase-3 subunit epsilon